MKSVVTCLMMLGVLSCFAAPADAGLATADVDFDRLVSSVNRLPAAADTNLQLVGHCHRGGGGRYYSGHRHAYRSHYRGGGYGGYYGRGHGYGYGRGYGGRGYGGRGYGGRGYYGGHRGYGHGGSGFGLYIGF